MLIQRVYEVNPLQCPQCRGQMKIVSFIERRQQDVIERILRYCGIWEGPLRTLANPRASPRASPEESTDPHELELVLEAEFLEAEFREAQDEVLPDLPPQDQPSPELQLVLDVRVPLARAVISLGWRRHVGLIGRR